MLTQGLTLVEEGKGKSRQIETKIINSLKSNIDRNQEVDFGMDKTKRISLSFNNIQNEGKGFFKLIFNALK